MPEHPVRLVSQDAFETLAGGIPYPVYVAPLDDGRVVLANEAFDGAFRIAGGARGTLAYSLFVDVAHCAAILARVRASESVAQEEMRVRRADGSEFSALVSSSPVEFDGRAARLTTVIDIDESRTDARRLAASERLLERVFDTIPHPIAVEDAQGRYVRVNHAFAHYVGADQASLIGTRPGDAGISRNEIAAVLEEDRAILSGTVEKLRAEVPGTAPSGEVVLEWTRAPLLDGEGAIDGVLDVGIDVTARVRVQAELARRRDRLEEMVRARTAELEAANRELTRNERLAAVGAVIGTVSHELRNPIGTMQMTFSTLRAHLAGDPSLDRAVERMERNIQRCSTIIQELLDYSRSREPELVGTVLDEWLGPVAEDQHASPDVALELDLRCGARSVPMDRLRMHQAVTNVLNNAVQAFAGHRSPTPARVVLATRPDAAGLVIEVRDNGPGIPAENLDRIFEPLFSTKSSGVGLGLPLVRQVLDEHGGRVDVESSGAGTIIRLHLSDAPSNEE